MKTQKTKPAAVQVQQDHRACLKIHFYNLHTPPCVEFAPKSVCADRKKPKHATKIHTAKAVNPRSGERKGEPPQTALNGPKQPESGQSRRDGGRRCRWRAAGGRRIWKCSACDYRRTGAGRVSAERRTGAKPTAEKAPESRTPSREHPARSCPNVGVSTHSICASRPPPTICAQPSVPPALAAFVRPQKTPRIIDIIGQQWYIEKKTTICRKPDNCQCNRR